MTSEPLVGNRAIEDAAIKYVMDLERRAGREPADRRNELSFAGDIWSPPRTIEVKAVGKGQRGWFVPLESRQYDAAMADPSFYLYIVDNVRQGDPKAFRLKVLAGDQLQRLLANAKRREYWELPIPVAEFDSAPGAESVSESRQPATVALDHEARLAAFTEAMVDIYRNARRKANYDAKIFLGMVMDRGGLETAQYLVRSGKPSDGYTALYERGHLELTVEALVVLPECNDLFDDHDRARARQRLLDYGFDVDAHLRRE